MTATALPLVSTIGERCRVCYQCVRECPAKAIRIAVYSGLIGAVLLAIVLGALITRSIVGRLARIGKALDQGAEGNLSVTVTDDTRDELGMLGNDFNVMTEKLAGMVGKVNRSTRELNAIAEAIAEASGRVVEAAHLQAAGLTTTSSAVLQINVSLKGALVELVHDATPPAGAAAPSDSFRSAHGRAAPKPTSPLFAPDWIFTKTPCPSGTGCWPSVLNTLVTRVGCGCSARSREAMGPKKSFDKPALAPTRMKTFIDWQNVPPSW